MKDSEQISEILIHSKMLGTVTNIEPYEKGVHEFYNNLGAGTSTPSDPMYGKIYLRGKFYDFTPSLINDYMGTSNTENSTSINSEQVAQELTAGNVSFEKNKIKAASLTSNLAELLYKIGKRIKINFGEIVHSQIMNLVGNGTPKASLIFPNLIYTLLVQQALKQQKPIIPVKTLSITVKLRKGTHQNDLTTTTPKEDPTDKTILLKYFQKRLKEIEKEEKRITRRHLELKEEKTEVLQWLQALKKDTEDRISQEERQEEEEEETQGENSEEESQEEGEDDQDVENQEESQE
ncbi:histone H3.v1-like [Ipomoea triloba]|uniref:histone H3.v1-like n=1 Tax=Ipomoea triloba TaxID=35885 RepID=UPI00125E2695|nr:histone H3.v1-like [Ipomoea triloba]